MKFWMLLPVGLLLMVIGAQLLFSTRKTQKQTADIHQSLGLDESAKINRSLLVYILTKLFGIAFLGAAFFIFYALWHKYLHA